MASSLPVIGVAAVPHEVIPAKATSVFVQYRTIANRGPRRFRGDEPVVGMAPE